MEMLEIPLDRTTPIHRQIEATLRGRIERGELPIGTRLPQTRDMARQLGVHALTVQKALRRLKLDGLIDRTPRLGSFVRGPVQTPVIALLFGPSLSDEHTHFYRALMRALRVEATGRWGARAYDGLQFGDRGKKPDGRNSYPRLREDCGQMSFRGAIVSGMDTRSWERIEPMRGLPVAWLGRLEEGADVTFDFGDFTRCAVNHFAGRGRRHVAYLRTFGDLPCARHDLDAFHAAVADRGIQKTEVHELDALYRFVYDEHAAYERVQSIVAEWNRTRWPDAILVSDDIVMRAVALALLNAPHPAARRADLMTWANEQVRLHYGLPVARYEVSVTQCAVRLKDILGRRLEGKPVSDGPERICGQLIGSD